MTVLSRSYEATVDLWRLEAEAALRHDWLTLVGLYELTPRQQYTFGSDPHVAFVLPTGPRIAGVLKLVRNRITLNLAEGIHATHNGALITNEFQLRTDAEGGPDLVQIGDLTLIPLQRGPRTLIRVRQHPNPAVASFVGRQWFPIDPNWRIEATFVPYDPPKPIAVTNILGDTTEQTSPGFARFTWAGREHQLDATGWHKGGLSFHFRDLTSGNETYGGGRFLHTAVPEQGFVTLDFNQAVHPPCAFTAYATCPKPLPQNQLSIRVAAGEQHAAERR